MKKIFIDGIYIYPPSSLWGFGGFPSSTVYLPIGMVGMAPDLSAVQSFFVLWKAGEAMLSHGFQSVGLHYFSFNGFFRTFINFLNIPPICEPITRSTILVVEI